MAVVTREWEYRRSTGTIQFSVDHTEHRFRFPEQPIPCSGGLFMVVNIAAATTDGGFHRTLNCLVSTGSDEEHYYHLHEAEFNTELRSYYPNISTSDASKLTETFMEILQLANAAHCCPAPGGGFGICHIVYFKIQPFLSLLLRQCHELAAEEAVEFIVKEEEEEDDHEFSGCPATRASIMELLKASSSSSCSVNEGGGDCGICMEDIETPRKMLMMPCSHLFHSWCLLNWLNNGHSCPICRYQMPAARFKSNVGGLVD